MGTTFWVLLIWIGGGNSQAVATDHYATREECRAAKEAIVYTSEKMSFVGGFLPQNVVCVEAKQ